MNIYLELKQKHSKEVNDFPIFFAFSDKQFAEGMDRLGLAINKDEDKIYSIGLGGFIKKTDSDKFSELLKRHSREMQSAIDNDTTGDNFIKQMFEYELENHEFSYTRDVDDTLDALDITQDQIDNNSNLKNGLQLAIKNVLKN